MEISSINNSIENQTASKTKQQSEALSKKAEEFRKEQIQQETQIREQKKNENSTFSTFA